MSTRAVVDIVRSLSLFADLSGPQLSSIDHIFDEQWFSPGERLLRRGFTGAGFFVILDGEAAVQFDDKELARLGRGDFFGEISILLGELPTADVVALGQLRCLVLAGNQLQDFLMEHPPVMYRMLQAQAARLRDNLKWRN